VKQDGRAVSEWADGWKVAFGSMAGFVLASTYTFGFGAFIQPLEEEFGWSRGDISIGLSVITLTGALISPFMGMLVDRFGPRRLGVPGALMFAAGFSTLALTTGNIWVWWGLWFLLTFAFVFTQPLIWSTAIASTFDRQRGLAFAVAMCGNGLASTLAPPLSTWAIATFGWRLAFPTIGLTVGLTVFPILYFFLHSGADKARADPARPLHAREAERPTPALYGMTAHRAFRSLVFAKLALVAFLFTFAAVGIVPNLIPILTSYGLSRAEAAAIAGVAGFSSIIGRLATGALLDRLNPNIVAGSIVLLPIGSCLLLLGWPGDLMVAILAAVVMGFSLGAEVDVVAFQTARQFGTARYGTIFGVITGIWSAAIASGPFVANRIYDITGSYELALKIFIPMFAMTSVLLLSLGRPPEFEPVETH